MLDKTRLEDEIERREMYRCPLSIRIITIVLFVSLCALGIYTFKLKQELSKKEQEIILIEENFQKEKSKLLNKIKNLEKKHVSSNKIK